MAAEGCVELQPKVPTSVARRRNGRPVAEAVVERHLTTTTILDQETRLLAGAHSAAGSVPSQHDDVDAQAVAAQAVAGDDRLVLVVGPAGTGKTTALGMAARLLAEQGRPVIGLAPSGKAADVLGAETGWPATTLAKLLHDVRSGRTPALPAGTTVVLDEAGMAGTDDLDALVGLGNIALVVDPTGLEDSEDAFAAVIARPANARTALAVSARLAGDQMIRVPATGPPAHATTALGAVAGSRTARPAEPCPVGPDAVTQFNMPSAEPTPDATPARATPAAEAWPDAPPASTTPSTERAPDVTASSASPVGAAGPDGAASAASMPASTPTPGAPSEEPAVVEDDDVARMARRLRQVETRRPPRRVRSR